MRRPMQKKNFIGFRDRVLIHLLGFEKDVYENIHHDEVDGQYRDFLIHLTQEGIADGVGTKQSTIYKELQTLSVQTIEGEEPLIRVLKKAHVPGKERTCAIYFLTQYGVDLAAQKRTYLEKKNLEIHGLTDRDIEVITIGELIQRLIQDGYEFKQINALLKIASAVTAEGVLDWKELISPPTVETITTKEAPLEEVKVEPKKPVIKAVENPYFNRTAIKEPKYFFGRKDEVNYIMSLLRNTQSCSIVGPRRIGKSSLINYVSNSKILNGHGLNPENYIFVQIDLEGLAELTQSEFFSMIIEEIRNRISDAELRKRMEGLLEKDNIRFLDLKNIIKDITDLGKSVIFLLDEFELITSNKNLDCNFFSGLRNLANTYNVGYITASHDPLLELTLSQETLGSPFFNFFTQINLGLMDDSAAHELITEPLQSYSVNFSNEVIDFIKHTCGPNPFFLQMLCFQVFELIKESGTVSDTDFAEIAKKFENEAKPHFQYYWNHVTPKEQQILTELHNTGGLKEQGMSHSEIQDLKNKALIIEDQNGIQLFSNAFMKFLSSVVGEGIAVQKPSEIPTSTTGELGERPKVEMTGAKGALEVPVKWGNNYFVNEDSPNVSVQVFKEITEQGIPGLFITRTPTDKAEEQWGLKKTNTIWLCSRTGKDYLRPALEKISHTIFEFINQNKRSVIFLDGVEYIINHNDFLRTLNLMDNIKEIVALNSSVLVFPMSSTIFSEKEMALLGKNSIEISDKNKPDFSKLED